MSNRPNSTLEEQAETAAAVAALLDKLHGLCEKALSPNEFKKTENLIDQIGAVFAIKGGFGSAAHG